MSVATIGVQLIQPVSGTPQQQAPSADMGNDRDSDRVNPSAPIQPSPAPGTGRIMDKTV